MSLSKFARLSLATAIGLSLIGCASKQKYEQIGYEEAKLATPPHNLSAYDYPFDDDGTYRKDWVTDKNAKRGRRWKPSPTPAPAQSAPPMMTQAPQYPTQAPTQSYTPPPPPRPAPVQAPAPAPKPQPRYHTVAKGDTLFSVSRRYGVSVGQLKATNGLTSDMIRIGQTLRLP